MAEPPKITIQANGPYHVEGDVPLVKKEVRVSEYGEPLTWVKTETLKTSGPYLLCRCGQSENRPFCDFTHELIDFDGTETADPRPTRERQVPLSGGRLTVKRDYSLCSEAGFCGTRLAAIEQLAAQTGDPQIRAQVMAMIERCPSGSLVYALEADPVEVEPDLPAQIAVTVEMTSAGPIAGPLWVTGGIPIQQSNGQMLEARNRVTLCCCGKSKNKPFCDGTHRAG